MLDDFDIKLDFTKLNLTTDSGSNCTFAKSQVCDIVESVTCFRQQLHLAVINSKEEFPDMTEMLKTGLAIVSFFNRSPKVYPNFITIQFTMGICCPFCLIQSIDTRSNSELQKELRLQKLSGPISISLNEINCTVTRTKNDRKLSEVFTTVLNGVDVANSEASTEAYPSISKTVPLPFVICSKMQSCKIKTELKNFAVIFDKHLLLRFPNLMRSSNNHVTAMVLDLR